MSIEDEIAILQRAPMFRDVDPVRLQVLALSADRIHFKAGERIYERGETADDVLLILSGEARTAEGLQLKTIVGHIGTLLQRPRVTTIHAVSDVEALRFGREEFVSVLKGCPQVSMAVILELARSFDESVNQRDAKVVK